MSIQSQINRITEAKNDIASAIAGKGVDVPAGTKIDGMANLVHNIQVGDDTSDATATATDMAEGVTAYVNGQKVTGALPVGGLQMTDCPLQMDSSGLNMWKVCKERKIMGGNNLVDLYCSASKLGNATAADVAEGVTFTSENGLKLTGTKEDPVAVANGTPSISVSSAGLITASVAQAAGLVEGKTTSATKQLTTQAAQTITPGTSNKTISYGRYLTGTQTIKGDSNLKAANIKSGISIFGITGTCEGLPSGVSKLASGTYTAPSDSSADLTITHNLGVKPDFSLLVLCTNTSSTSVKSARFYNAQIHKTFMNGSTKVYGRSLVHYFSSSGSISNSSSYDTTDTLATTTQVIFKGNSTGPLKSGVTYQWICGVMSSVN